MDVALAEKGFPRAPLKIIEICNAKYASQVLNEDVRIFLMLPCHPRFRSSSPRRASSSWRPRWRPSCSRLSMRRENRLRASAAVPALRSESWPRR